MRLRLIASDLDGTLLQSDKQISAYTRETLVWAAAQGVVFVPATGRALSAVPQEVLGLPGVEYVITSNGSSIYSVKEEKTIYSLQMETASVEAVRALLGQLPQDRLAAEAFVDGVPYAQQSYLADPESYGSSGTGVEYVKRTRRPVSDLDVFLEAHAAQIDSMTFVSADPEVLQHCRTMVEKQVPQIMMTSSMPHMLEIGHCDAGKGKTLLYLLDRLGIPAQETAAFGDAHNDLDMLCSVAYGIAMANAAEECREAAYLVTDTNDADGVAKAIRKLMG